jgi:Uma2 family endonuclease
MNQLQTPIICETWIKAPWQEYLQIIEKLDQNKSYYKSYYSDGQYRIEMTPIGNDHACDHTIVMLAIHLYALAKTMDFQGRDNVSYRKTGYREIQPDASYYFGEQAGIIPYGTTIIDLDIYPPPALVIEVANRTLADDLGNKRLIYEELRLSEYWVVDVEKACIIAFAMIDRGSQRIEISRILPDLKISLLNEALQRSRQENHGRVGQWLMQQLNG